MTVTLFACAPGDRDVPADSSVTLDSTLDSGPLVIYTVSYPLAFFAERIGGDLVEVHFPVPEDEDPAYWSPGPKTIVAYQGADLILLNGAGYAGWVQRATLPSSKLVDTSSALSDRFVPMEGTVSHSHGPEGEHEHTGWAFTTWLDPTFAAEQAKAVMEALTKERPEAGPELRDAFMILESAMLTIDARLETAAGAIGDAPLLFSHPVYQYLERRYGLDGISFHWEPEEAPDLGELKQLLEHHPARWMVWESEPRPETVGALEQRGVQSVVFDPCANRPKIGDFLTVMSANASAFETIAHSIS